ncbi:MAG: hypothetical protein A4E19_18005 [Nitrospira sp. SG-bin1]|nr:MAG: hypothetical protein A4E19_18005 [Nitrospira sp. SG-bin1]
MTETPLLLDRLRRRGSWRLGAQERARRQTKQAKQTARRDPWSLTFPDRLKALGEKFVRQALTHPAFVFMSPSEIRQSIENRLWSIAASQPIWWGSGPALKREATPEQLMALEKARQRKIEIQREVDALYVPPNGLDQRTTPAFQENSQGGLQKELVEPEQRPPQHQAP